MLLGFEADYAHFPDFFLILLARKSPLPRRPRSINFTYIVYKQKAEI